MNIKKLISKMYGYVVSIVFMSFLIGLNLIFFGRVSAWSEIVAIDLVVIAIVLLLALLLDLLCIIFMHLIRNCRDCFLLRRCVISSMLASQFPQHFQTRYNLFNAMFFQAEHTQLTLIVVYLGHKYHLKTRWIMTVLAGLLIIGTVYLRYHYVVDLIGGAIFFLFTIWSGKKIQDWWEYKKDSKR